jgi:hypothetical protein
MDEGSDSLAWAILCGHGVNGTDSFSVDTLTGRLRGEDDTTIGPIDDSIYPATPRKYVWSKS